MAATFASRSRSLLQNVINRNRPCSFATENAFGAFKYFGTIAAADEGSASAEKPRSVPVHTAFELLSQGRYRYLDVRTHEEFVAGHPPGAINIPYWLKYGLADSKNPNFVEDVSSHFQKDEEILVGCKRGIRSLYAATDLHSAGFKRVTDVAGGYTAWTENGFPTDQ